MKIAELHEEYEFIALSYFWGEGEPENPIFIDKATGTFGPQQAFGVAEALGGEVAAETFTSLGQKQSVGIWDATTMMTKKRILVKPNLFRALKALRDSEQEVAVWVDAICINQSNQAEKESQVSRMAEIYSTADLVAIWLGAADQLGRTDRAMVFRERTGLETLITDEFAQHWSGRPGSQGSSPEASSSMKRMHTNEHSTLHVKGFELGKIVWRTDPIPDGVIPLTALNKLGWTIPQGGDEMVDSVPDTAWRTLVANRGIDGKNPLSWYHRACLRCLINDTPNGHINTKTLLERDPTKIMKEFLKRVQAVTWNRVVLEAKTDQQPLVGIGPPGTEQGDIVCILFGCSVPCVLRPLSVDKSNSNFEYVGEAFIYGKMDGEAVLMTPAELEKRTVEFRLTSVTRELSIRTSLFYIPFIYVLIRFTKIYRL